MDLVEAGGVEVLGHIDNTEVVGFQVPSWPPKPRFPATLARFGTVTPLKGKMGRTVPERSESQRCLPITDLSASICAKGIYRQVLFDPRAKARCLDHSPSGRPFAPATGQGCRRPER